MRCLALLIALLASPMSWAQIYKYTDANGNTVYTNQPPGGSKAKEVNLPPLNSISPGTPAPAPEPPPSSVQPAASAQAYSVLALAGLPSEEALRANNGTFTVGVTLTPKLLPGHMLQLVLDGKPYGEPSNVPRLQVVNADRGEHNLAVRVLAGDSMVQQSETVTFTVQRVHL
ncbi:MULTISPECIES: DUF4124 domain-containing protein [unclassified Pseudomonas]|uniref:DUF4124 domain-containing protein n=1 Tax=unclassified Pseudomonas TaxID=196821 RepID=UPI000BC69151|nr:MULTISPECIES: DUF4124 domain-containing protein [unclassified Pseudomonas]PVZ10298.1 uncharacterized protein DUF4124 [Pseudomonas sp. URIL14HWK12:I12]PVZ21724.1 uncharacterized protein DUF4124 [Pseudomonas sp. URIL14HWK12:I10]PVZ31193.1 uncharacterized protein DUF4124 [Pseudomonas sp. URIL14HWK12:I11]SNZ18010.1 protein of unknown function [Pseudomonas sp. URIL14HWK12:I9]